MVEIVGCVKMTHDTATRWKRNQFDFQNTEFAFLNFLSRKLFLFLSILRLADFAQ